MPREFKVGQVVGHFGVKARIVKVLKKTLHLDINGETKKNVYQYQVEVGQIPVTQKKAPAKKKSGSLTDEIIQIIRDNSSVIRDILSGSDTIDPDILKELDPNDFTDNMIIIQNGDDEYSINNQPDYIDKERLLIAADQLNDLSDNEVFVIVHNKKNITKEWS